MVPKNVWWMPEDIFSGNRKWSEGASEEELIDLAIRFDWAWVNIEIFDPKEKVIEFKIEASHS